MKERFKIFLIVKGYNIKAPIGKPSTINDYQKRIEKVCRWEGYTWDELAENISEIIQIYDIGGPKEQFGNMSQKGIISSLKIYEEFVIHTNKVRIK